MRELQSSLWRTISYDPPSKRGLKMNARQLFTRVFLVGTALFSSMHAKDLSSSLEESLELRKISEYWKEKDYKAAKLRINEFLSRNPASSYNDQLYAMLGDLHFQEKNYQEALASYDKIQSKEFILKSQFNRLHSLYEMGKYQEFIASSELFLKDPSAKADKIQTICFELAESYFCIANAPENMETKKQLLKNALGQYQQLMETAFCDMTLEPQAQIYLFLEEHQKAASLFLLLAEKDAAKKEDWLFHAASQQLHFDKKAAADTFGAIITQGGKYASKAAFNQLTLLFQEKRYKDFILSFDKGSKHLPPDQIPLMRYYLGKSLLHTRDFSRAIDPLCASLASKTLDRSQEKNALLSLVTCANETKDLLLFEKVLAHLKTSFPGDAKTSHILLMHSQLCRDKKDWAKARDDIEEVLKHSPGHPEREALVYDIGQLFMQEDKWEEAALAFHLFAKEFPQSNQKRVALRNGVHARLEDLKHASIESKGIKKQLLLSSLLQALEDGRTFSETEKQQMRYLLGKTEYELGQYEEAIGLLSEYVRDYYKDPTCTDAYLLLAYCYKQGSGDDIHFVLNAEKALAHNPNLENAQDLHITLYNTYLSLCANAFVDEKQELTSKAASHLFLAIDKPISKENQRWLAGYYLQQYQSGQTEAIEKAAIVLEKLLGIDSENISLSIDCENLDREAEAIKLASIYEKTGRFKKEAQLLSALTQEQKAHSNFQWKYQRMALFELGKTYQRLGENEIAAKTYEELIATSSHISSYFAIAAVVENAKLQFNMLPKEEQKEDSQSVICICNALKNVQITRKLHSEPLHLEAALCYIDIKTKLADPGQRFDRKKFLLEQLKENFSSETDPLVSQYLAASAQFPEKRDLYDQYMAYIDAMILKIEAEKNQSIAGLKEAKGLFDQLLKQSANDTLKERIRTEALALDL